MVKQAHAGTYYTVIPTEVIIWCAGLPGLVKKVKGPAQAKLGRGNLQS